MTSIYYKGEVYVEAGKAFDPFLLLAVDPKIRDLVEKINLLPFVAKTHFSCAGYGPHAKYYAVYPDRDWIVKNKNFGKIHTRGFAYLMIEYDPKASWHQFHKELRQIVASSNKEVPVSMDFYTRKGRSIFTYYLLPPSTKAPPKSYRKKWNQVRDLVQKYSEEGGRADSVASSPQKAKTSSWN